MDERDVPDNKATFLDISEGAIGVKGVKGGTCSIDLLLSNCITTLNSSFDTCDAKTLKNHFQPGYHTM